MSGDIVERLRAEVVPCPGKGWDGNGVQHCAECCFGTGVDAATADELRVMVLARDAADTIKNLTAERDASRLMISDLTAEVERLRAAGDALADNLRRRAALSDMPPLLRGDGSWANVGQALDAWKEARRER